MRKLLLATALTMVMAPAMAKSSGWYVMNFEAGKCATAASVSGKAGVGYTPDEFHRFLRKTNILDKVEVVKNDEGVITAVIIRAKLNERSDDLTEYYWFPTAETCEAGRQALIQAGEMADDMDDLK